MAEILNPHDADLESVILGACLAESTAMVLVSGKLCPEMFYEAKYGEIFAALLAMHRAGKAIDIITVRAELAARGKLEFVGGAFELARLLGRVASSAHLEYHALILRGMYIRREMISGLHRLLAVAADESVDLGDALAGLHQLIEHLEGKTDFAGCLRDMDRLMLDTLRQMDGRVANNRNGITGIPTGLSDLRESGAIEQDADVVMLLYRPALYGLTSERKSKFPSEGLGMVILAKHRNGETGDVYFGHNPTLTKIGEYEPTLEWMARNARSSC